MIAELVPELIQTLVLLSDIFIIAVLLVRFGDIRNGYIARLNRLFEKHSYTFAFLVALTATLGSLFYSEIMGYDPCLLCWYQRIMMYPLTIIFGAAILFKRKDVHFYTVPMSVIGGIIAIYHYYTQLFPEGATCIIDSTVDCAAKYTLAYGYITIPVMAITGFALIIMFSFWRR